MRERQRLFFALWPDEALRTALDPLAKLKRECGGRAHPAANLHITLTFLGGVDSDTRNCLERAAGEIVSSPFELILNRFGYWPRPKVVWLGCDETPEYLTGLVQALNQVTEQCGLQAEKRPYHPHLTLLRKARQGPAGRAPELHWQVNDFVLAQSVSVPSGVEYRVLRRWPLLEQQTGN